MLARVPLRSAVLSAFLLLTLAPAATAYVYWTDSKGVGRAALNGSQVKDGFVPAKNACGLAVSSHFVYWMGGGSVSKRNVDRANLDGSHVKTNLFPKLGFVRFCSVATASSHVFWGYAAPPSGRGGGFKNPIARAGSGGSNVHKKFIDSGTFADTGPDTVAAKHLYYLSQVEKANGDQIYAFMRVPLAGGHPKVLFTRKWTGSGWGLAAAGKRLYWNTGTWIGRAKLDGSGRKPKFVKSAGPDGGSCGLAAAAGRLYWGQTGRLASVRTDGTHPAQSAIGGENCPVVGAADLRGAPMR